MKSLKCLICLAIFIAQASLASVQAETTSKNAALPGSSGYLYFSSFRNYRPAAAHFQSAIRAEITAINQALDIADEKKISAKLTTARKRLLQKSKTLSRGYHDEIYFLVGFIEEHLGRDDYAVKYYGKSLQLSANNPVAIFRRALLHKKHNRTEQAANDFREVAWRTSRLSNESQFLLGESLLELGRTTEALNVLDRAHAQHPHYAPMARLILKTRQQLLAETKDPAERAKIHASTINYLTKITQSDPNDRDASLMLGRMLLQNADPLVDSEKLAQAEKLALRFASSSGYKDSDAVRLVFDAQLKRNNFEQAQKTIETGLKAKPDSSTLLQAQKQITIQKATIQ